MPLAHYFSQEPCNFPYTSQSDNTPKSLLQQQQNSSKGRFDKKALFESISAEKMLKPNLLEVTVVKRNQRARLVIRSN